jgi:hypothetical protein
MRITYNILLVLIVLAGPAKSADLLVNSISKVVIIDVTKDVLIFTNNVVFSKNFRLHTNNLLLVSGDLTKPIEVQGPKPRLSDVTNITYNAKITKAGYLLRRQASKSELHKDADNELIDLLIEAGDIPADTTGMSKGDIKKAERRLLKASKGKGSAKKADRDRSIRISQLRSIIVSEGGDPDDAIVHKIPK